MRRGHLACHHPRDEVFRRISRARRRRTSLHSLIPPHKSWKVICELSIPNMATVPKNLAFPVIADISTRYVDEASGQVFGGVDSFSSLIIDGRVIQPVMTAGTNAEWIPQTVRGTADLLESIRTKHKR